MSSATTNSTRERLLNAAGEVFAREGFDRATVRAICRRAEANVASVNYHFGDKATLYREAIRYAFARLHARHPQPEPSTHLSVAERVHSHIERFLARLLLAGESWHARLLAQEMSEPGQALEQVAERYMRPQIEALEALLREALPDMPAETCRLHVLGLVGQCVFYRHARPVLDALYGPQTYGQGDLPALTRHIANQFLAGAGLSSTGDL
jgi:AcrR family transcriptional regulator